MVAASASLSSNPDADAAMDRYADGDESAFPELYRAANPRLYAYALRLTRNEAQTQDLVQHTWEMVCRARGTFMQGSSVMAWLFCILRNRECDVRRRPRVEELSSDGTNDPGHCTPHPDPSECVETKELDELVRQQLKLLPACQRDAVELFFYAGLSQSEVAEVLDSSVAGIKSRIQRATETLRTVFNDRAPRANDP
jgi:RNA polymerase sigma-70 factor, ECF subfamily